MLCLIKPLPDSYAIINHTGYRRCYSHSKCFSTGALVCHLAAQCLDSERRFLLPVAPPERGGKRGSFPLWVDVQKLCNMCALQ